MFGFSKKATKKEETVNANDFMEAEQETSAEDEMIETELSIPADWKMDTEERYVYAFHNNESPQLKKNQVSIYGMELTKSEHNSFIATALLQNTIPKSIEFQHTTIQLLGPDEELIAKREFDLNRVGSIPPNGARPWKFTFPEKTVVNDHETAPREWSLAFELKKKHQLDLEESWEKSIADDTKAELERIVAQAPKLKPGELNLMGLSARQNEQNDLIVTLLIRNGADRNMELQQIPLAVKDANGNEIARGGFKLEDFTLKANTSKPWTFVFPASSVNQEEMDLSRWSVHPIYNK